MDWLSFFSSMTGHLVWPIVVVVALFRLPEPLAGLINRLRAVKKGDWSAEFAPVESEVDEASTEIISRADEQDRSSLPSYDPADLDPVAVELDGIAKGAESNPSYAVVAAWRLLEQSVAVAYSTRFPDSRTPARRLSARRMLERLRAESLLTERALGAFDDLRGLRNRVAHGELDPTPGGAVGFVDAVRSLALALEIAGSAPQ